MNKEILAKTADEQRTEDNGLHVSPACIKPNVMRRLFHDRYACIKNRYGWIGLFQTSLNFKNIFILHWCFIKSSLHPSIRFGFTFLGFVLPVIKRHRSLLSINFYTWDGKPAGYLSIMFLYFPSIDFRIGNGKTWFWLRSENWYAYECDKINRRKLYGNDMPF